MPYERRATSDHSTLAPAARGGVKRERAQRSGSFATTGRVIFFFLFNSINVEDRLLAS